MSQKYMRNNDYEITKIDDEWLILDTDHYTITKLNDMGGYCWSLLNEPQSNSTLAKRIMEEFSTEAPIHLIEKDMEAFLAHLLQCGLIQYAA